MNINKEIHPDDVVPEDLPIILELPVPNGTKDEINISKAGIQIIKAMIKNSPENSIYGNMQIGMDILSKTENTVVVKFDIIDTVLNAKE